MLGRVKALAVGGTVLAAILGILGVIGYSVQALPHDVTGRTRGTAVSTQAPAAAAAPAPAAAPVQVSPAAAPAIGVFENGVPQSWRLIDGFAAATGTRPGIALYYSAWGEPFWASFAETARQHHAIALVQIQPGNISLAAIAAGRYDTYLRSYAHAVRAFGHPVILGFGHEMNGTWYSWGAGHVSAAAFVAAWRHVVTVFRSSGALNVTWLWGISSLNAAKSPLRQWWPGSAWVNWVGVDGYYYRPADTFSSVFGTTIGQVRRFTRRPVLISETGIGPSSRQAVQLDGLFRGIRSDDLVGLVWFDMAQHGGAYHQDWRLEDSRAALAAFRRAVQLYG